MKNASQNQNRKINHVQLWLFLLLFTTAFSPLGVRGQQTFTCEFSNPDGNIVYSCASVVTATINMPAANNPIQQIQLIFPNSFEITLVDGLPFPPSTVPIPGGNYNGPYSGTDLLGQWIPVQSNASQMIVTLAYRSCDIYLPINAATFNTNHLYFDCKGYSGTATNITYNASLLPGNPGLQILGGAAVANNGITNIPQAVEVIGTPGVPYNLTTNYNVYSAINDEVFTRYFDIIINSASIEEFELNISKELDVDEEDLSFVAANGLSILSSLTNSQNNFPNVGFGNYSLTFSNNPQPGFYTIPIGAYSTNGNVTKITLAQRVKKNCAHNGTANVSVRINCGSCNQQVFSIPLPLEATDQNNFTTFDNAPSITLTSNSAPSNSICGTNFTYKFDYTYSNDVISRLNNFILPINTQSFQVQSVEVGDGNTFTTVPVNFYTINQPLATSVLNININGYFGTAISPPNPCFTNILPNSNPPIYGAWINTNTNVTHLVIKVNLLPIFQTQTPSCPDLPINLSRPAPLNECTLTLSNTCGGGVNLVEFPLTDPTQPIAGLINSNVTSPLDLGMSNIAPFSYTIQIPEQSPFDINVDNNTQIACSTITYQATFSTSSGNLGAFNGNGVITNAFINNNGTMIPVGVTLVGGDYLLNLPSIAPNSGFYIYNLSFDLSGLACPACTTNTGGPCIPTPTFGANLYELNIAAVCSTCSPNDIRRNILCSQNPIEIHCTGQCDSPVGFEHDITSPDIQRTTFGWINEYDYLNNFANPLSLANLTGSTAWNALSDDDKELQLNSVYPYDLFTYKAAGSVKPETTATFIFTHLGLELRYPQGALGNNFLEMISYEAVFTDASNSSNTHTINNINYPVLFPSGSAVPAQTTQPIAIPVNSYTQLLQWEAGSTTNPIGLYQQGIDIHTTTYNITFTATFRQIKNTPAGSYDVPIYGQFVGESYDDGTVSGTVGYHHLTSCDPWAADLRVVIPSVQVIQNSEYTGNIELPNNVQPPVGVVNAPIPSSCKFGHAIGIRHSGGNGVMPDFFPEYRPLTSWPQQISAADIESGTGFFPGAYTYTVASGNLINGTDPLLPPLTRQLPPNNLQGLVLTLKEECPNPGAPATQDLPNDLIINQYAYINSSHLLTSTLTSPTIIPAVNPPGGTTNCNFLTLPGGAGTINIPNTNSIYNFDYAIPTSAIGLPFAIRVIPPLNLNVTIANINIPGYTTQVGDWFVFTSGLSNTNPVACSMEIQLGGLNGCYSDPFDVDFEVQVFCSESQVPTVAIPNPVPCLTCTNTRTFKRGVSDLSATVINTAFLPSANGCDFVFELTLTNPLNQPVIDLSALVLNFSTGMIFQPSLSYLNVNGAPPNQNIFTQWPFGFSQNNNGLTSNSVFGITIDNFILNPGEILTYRLTFQLAEAFCSGFYDPTQAIFGMSFYGMNICNDNHFSFLPVNINPNDLSNYMSLITQNATCCVPNPEVTVTHVCDANATDGVIVVDYPNFGPGVIARIFKPELCTQNPCSTPIAFTINPLTINSTNAQFGLGVGTYRLVVWNPATGAFFEQFVVIEDHSFLYANLLGIPSPVCSGTTVQLQANFNTLEPNASNNVTYQINLDGLPIIGASGPIANIMNPNSYSTVINSNGTYSVTLSNGSCSLTSPNITASVNTTPSIAAGTVTMCSTDAFLYNPAVIATNVVPAGTVYTWPLPTLPGGVTGATAQSGGSSAISQVLVNNTSAPQTVTYAITATSTTTTTCSSTFDLVVTVNPIPDIATQTAIICSGNQFNISPTNVAPNIVPLGTLYTWGAPSVTGGILGGSAVNIGQTSIGQTLSHSVITAQTATYTVTATSNGCTSMPFLAEVTVNPLPVASISPAGPLDLCDGSQITLTASGGTSYSWSPTIGLSATNIANPTANPTVSTSYIVTVEDANGCINTASVQVNVLPLPSVPTLIAGGPTTICAGSAVTLSTAPVAGCTYLWMLGTNTINGATSNTYNATISGTYTVAVINSFNCSSAVSNPLQVTVNPTPTVSIAANPGNTVILSTSVALTAQIQPGATVVDWFDPTNVSLGSTATSITINPSTAGIFTYTVVVSLNGCTASETIDIEVLDIPLSCIQNPASLIVGAGTHYLSTLIIDWAATPGLPYVDYVATPNISTIDGVDIAVIGELIIDIPVEFTNSNFYAYDNAKITNEAGNNLHLNHNTFSACGNHLWTGIENKGWMRMQDCSIEDAYYGINMIVESTNHVNYSTFKNNLYGVYCSLPAPYISPSIDFINGYNTFTNPTDIKPYYDGTTSVIYKKSKAGIYLYNFTDVDIDYPTTSGSGQPGTMFIDIPCGIFTHNTNLTVNNAKFENILTFTNPMGAAPEFFSGFAIRHQSSNAPYTFAIFPYEGISQNITFQNCRNGIGLVRSHAKIFDIGFKEVRTGIWGAALQYCSVSIDNNVIDMARLAGITLNIVDFVNGITLTNNKINVLSGDHANLGINVSAFAPNNTINSYIYMNKNRIEVLNGQAGIFVRNLQNAQIIENRVKRHAFTINIPWFNINITPNPMWAGIRVQNNKTAKVTCNEILLGNVWGAPVNTGSDIFVSNSPKTELTCNTVDGKAFNGINIVGPCPSSTLQANDIGSHGIGLYLSNTAIIGPQLYTNGSTRTNGNKWTGTYSNIPYNNAGAVNENVLDQFTGLFSQSVVQQNLINVDVTTGMGSSNLYPVNHPDNNTTYNSSGNQIWFDYLPFTPLVCGFSPMDNCDPIPMISPIANSMGLSEAIALGLITSSEYREQCKWTLNKDLLAELNLLDSILITNDTLLQFFNAPSKENLKELNNIESKAEGAKVVKDQYATQITQYESQINLLKENINEQLLLLQDSILYDSAYTQYQLLKQDYLQLCNEKQELENEILQEHNELGNEGLLANNNFVPENYNEALSKIVNDVYYRTYGRGITELSGQDIALLESIIHICPQAGGPAVYMARALYMTVNDTIEYNDSLVCRQVNLFKESQEQWEQKAEIKVNKEKLNLLVFPNPFTGILQWRITGEHNDGIITIKDLVGKNIRHENVNADKKEGSLDLSALSKGVYMIHYSDTEFVTTKKIVKQ